MKGETEEPMRSEHRRPARIDVPPFTPPERARFTFIDLFAGIGGFRLGLQQAGGRCVFSSEWDKGAQDTYLANFGELPHGDITLAETQAAIPEKFDLLCAGFPCQPFSISGKMRGFEDTRGTLIYEVFKIMATHRPKVMLLENVKHLRYHDKGRTLRVILQALEELGYHVRWTILNASDFGVPQNRERVIIVCTLQKPFSFVPLAMCHNRVVLRDFFDKEGEFEYMTDPYTLLPKTTLQDSGLIFAGYRNKRIRTVGVNPDTLHLSRVHKQPNRIYSADGVHPALPSQESSGRFWILNAGQVRKLTLGECYRIMGFPENFCRTGAIGEQYRQVGNSVCVPMVAAIGREIVKQGMLPSADGQSSPISPGMPSLAPSE